MSYPNMRPQEAAMMPDKNINIVFFPWYSFALLLEIMPPAIFSLFFLSLFRNVQNRKARQSEQFISKRENRIDPKYIILIRKSK